MQIIKDFEFLYPSKLLQNNYLKVRWSNNGFLNFRLQKIQKKL